MSKFLLTSWLKNVFASGATKRRMSRKDRTRVGIEFLEERLTLTAYTVTMATDSSLNSAGSGAGTQGDLRYVLNRAVYDTEPATISFDAKLANQTIQLGTRSGSAPLWTPANGPVGVYGQTSFFIGAGNQITIDGSNAPGITIKGDGIGRVFTITGGSLELVNLKITGGIARGGNGGFGGGGGAAGLGGSVFVDGAKFTARGCTFFNNMAIGGNGGDATENEQSFKLFGGGMGGGGGLSGSGGDAQGVTGANGGGLNGGLGTKDRSKPVTVTTLYLTGPDAGKVEIKSNNGSYGGGGGGGGAPSTDPNQRNPALLTSTFYDAGNFKYVSGTGGRGGFGGGGGGGFLVGGMGGFGGGGGGGFRGFYRSGINRYIDFTNSPDEPQLGGFGGGNGGVSGRMRGDVFRTHFLGGAGGGGAGLGGAIFSNGGSLTLVGTEFFNNNVQGGKPGEKAGLAIWGQPLYAAQPGAARGTAVFMVNGDLYAAHFHGSQYPAVNNPYEGLSFFDMISDRVSQDAKGGGILRAAFGDVEDRKDDRFDYTNGSGSASIQVRELTVPQLTLAQTSREFDGTPFAVSVRANGNQPEAAPTLQYFRVNANGSLTDLGSTAPSAVGSYRVKATTPDSANYLTTSAMLDFAITKITPSINIVTPSGYGDFAPAASATISGVGGASASTLEGVPVTLRYAVYNPISGQTSDLGTRIPNSGGTYLVTATFAGSNSYLGLTVTKSYTLTATEPSLLVTTDVDENNGTSDPSVGNGASLREVLLYAQTLDYTANIRFAPSLSGHSLNNASSPIVINSSVNLIGLGADQLAISGLRSVPVLVVNSGIVTMSGITIKNGNAQASGMGGGIVNNSSLLLNNCVIRDNIAGQGGGIYNTGTIVLNDCSIRDNNLSGSASAGGGIFNLGSVTMNRGEIIRNSAFFGGGVSNYGSFAATNVTILSNIATTSGGGVANWSTPLTPTSSPSSGSHATADLLSSVIANNSSPSGPDVMGIVHSLGNNTVSQSSGSFGWVSSDHLNIGTIPTSGITPVVRVLTGLAVYTGSPINVFVDVRDPYTNLQAIGSPNATITVDYYSGTTKLSGAPVDVGYYSAIAHFSDSGRYGAADSASQSFTVTPKDLIVDNTADVFDGNFAAGQLTLREAVYLANNAFDPNSLLLGNYSRTINFSPALNGQTVTLSSDPLQLITPIDIIGPGADKLTLSGARFIHNSNPVTIAGLTLTGAAGPVINNGDAALNITDCVFTNNGGGTSSAGVLTNNGGGTVTILNSTFADNSGSAFGAIGNTGKMTLINSTVSNNYVQNGYTVANYGELKIVNSTITDNRGGNSGAALWNIFGTLTIANSIVAKSSFFTTSSQRSTDVLGTFTSLGHNLIGQADGSTGWLASGEDASDQIGTTDAKIDPLLGSLSANGGTVPTHALLAGSPAIGKGSVALALDASGNALTTAPNGVPRVFKNKTDIGAFQNIPADLTDMTMTASSIGSSYGQSVTFTAQVADLSDQIVPTGSVHFFDGATDLGAGTLIQSPVNTNNISTWTLTTSALAAGSHNLTAHFSGGIFFAAADTSLGFTVSRADQAISFTLPEAPLTFSEGLNVTLSATGGDSGNPIVFNIDPSSTGSGEINNGILSISEVGTFVINANQSGNENYNPAAQTPQTLTVVRAAQVINFTALEPVGFSLGLSIPLSATGGGSGNPVTFRIDTNNEVNTGSGEITSEGLNVSSAGTFVIIAEQAGSTNYSAAVPVQRTLTVEKGTQTITFPAFESSIDLVPGLQVYLTASAPAGLMSYSIDSSSTGTGTIDGDVLTVTSAGQLVINANQSGNDNFLAAEQLQRTLVVNKGQTLLAIGDVTIPFTGQPTAYPDTAVYVFGVAEGTLSYTYNGESTAPSNAGTYAVQVTFTPTDTNNYEGVTGSANMTLENISSGLSVTTPDGATWFLATTGPTTDGADRFIYRQLPGGELEFSGGWATDLALQNDGTVLAKNVFGDVYARVGSANSIGTSWSIRPRVNAGDGAVWFFGTDGLGDDHNVYRWPDNGDVAFTAGYGTDLGVQVDGSVLAFNSLGNAYVRVGSANSIGSEWQLLTTTATAGDGALWFLGSDGPGGSNNYIYRAKQSEGIQFSGGNGTSLRTASTGAVSAINSINQRYLRVGSESGLGSNWSLLQIPNATIEVADTSLIIGETSPVTITFNQEVAGFTNDDLTIANGTLSTVTTTDNITFTAELTPTSNIEDTSNVVTLNNATVSDVLGLPGLSTTDSNNYAVDTRRPVAVSFTRLNPTAATTNANSLVFLATFSEDVTDVDAADFAVNGGTTALVSDVTSASGSSYRVTISQGDLADFNGVIGLDFAAAPSINDLAGNSLETAEPESDGTFLLDHVAPQPVISSTVTGPTQQASIPITVSFDAAVTGFTADDLSISGGSVSDFSGEGTTYSFNLTPSNDGLLTIDIAAAAAQDGADNDSLAATQFSIVSDRTAPTADIVDVTPDPRTTNAGVVSINFVEDVSGVDVSDFSLTRDGQSVDISGLTVTGGSKSYMLDLSSVTVANGTYQLRLNGTGSGIVDAAGNVLASNAADDWTRTSPTVSLSVDHDSIAESGSAIVTATLSQATDVDVTIDLDVTGTASGNTDYTTSGTQIVISKGQTSGSVTVTPTDESLDEPAETVIVSLSSLSNATPGATTSATISITDNDAAPINATATGGKLVITSTQDIPTDVRVTLNSTTNEIEVTSYTDGVAATVFSFSAANVSGGVQATLGSQSDRFDVSGIALRSTILGGDGNDSIFGSQGIDSVLGGAGDDMLQLNGSDDIAFGGDGNDMLRGGGGRDSLVGDAGNDSLFGLGSVDSLVGGSGIDLLDGGDSATQIEDDFAGELTLLNTGYQTVRGDHVIAQSISYATLTGSAGNDSYNGLSFNSGLVTVFGGSGDDILRGGSTKDVFYGDGGNDILNGGGNQDMLFGGDGNDIVNGVGGADILSGGPGNDRLSGGEGDNQIREDIDGSFTLATRTGGLTMTGLGTDFIESRFVAATIYGGVNADSIDLSAFVGVASIYGNDGNDKITGTSSNDRLYGGSGNDVVNGRDGNDMLFGELGDDELNGDAGNDQLRGGAGTDVINGGQGIDTQFEQANENFSIIGLQITSSATGTETPTNIERFSLQGGSSANLLDARQSSLPVSMSGGNGNDTLLGSAFNDTVLGESGDDILSGGAGNDDLRGGNGNDIQYETLDVDATITDSKLTSTALGTDTVSEIEGIVLIGGASNNRFNASAATVRVTLLGGAGNDTLIGGSQADILIGGNRASSTSGIDSLSGNGGVDILDNDPADTHVNAGADAVLADVFATLPNWIDAL